tara:strand:- start:101 stop:2281 length:2181 start_codon:yes stop_codon:yes gene_type:complete
MGRKPRQEPVKEYLENPRTTWLFSSPHQFYECFGDTDHKYLTQASKGNRLGKETYRIVLHFPNKFHNDRDTYLDKMKKSPTFGRFFNTDLGYSRIRWDAGSQPSAQLILHDKKGRRQEFFLTGRTNNPKGAAIMATTSFPTMIKKWKPLKANTKAKDAVKDADGNMGKWIRSEKLVLCPVRVGMLNVSASKPGQIKLSRTKPVIECGKGVSQSGASPMEFMVKNAETENMMAEEDICAFYEAQGLPNLLEIQDVEIMDSETEQQAIERAYYNPSEAMVGTDETLDGFRPVDSATVDLTSNQPTANYGAEGRKMYCAECGSHTHHKYAEGETATYEPSDEPDMVSSSDFDNPTNADFSAEGDEVSVADVEASVEPANEPIAVAEGTSLDGYAPLDSIEEGAPIGHGVNQFFGSAEGVEEALLDESTTNITVEEGVSLDGYSGVDSVVVEAPLGHGVTQWYAEGDEPEPQFDEGITGQDGPSADPTNADFSAEGFEAYHAEGSKRTGFVFPKRKAWPIGNKEHAIKALNYMKGGFGDEDDYPKIRAAIKERYGTLKLSEHHKGQGYDDEMDESLGMRHRGMHEQSFKDRRDEASAMDKMHSKMGRKYDDVMAMDAEINRWHDKETGQFTGKWSKHRGNGEFQTHNADTAGYLQDGSLSMDGYTPLESVEVDRSSYQPTQNYGADEIFGDKPGTYLGKATFGALTGVTIFGASLAALMSIGALLNRNNE